MIMKIRKDKLKSACIICNYKMENTCHILPRQSSGVKLVWNESLMKLKEWLESSKGSALNMVCNFKERKEIDTSDGNIFDDIDRVFKIK